MDKGNILGTAGQQERRSLGPGNFSGHCHFGVSVTHSQTLILTYVVDLGGTREFGEAPKGFHRECGILCSRLTSSIAWALP